MHNKSIILVDENVSMLVIHSKVFTVPMVTSCHISSRYEKYKNNKAHSYYWQQK